MPLLLGLTCVSACAADDSTDADDLTDLVGLDAKSDAFSYRLELLGTLSYGAHSASVLHDGTPRFQGYAFSAGDGDRIVAQVASETPSTVPIVWILNASFQVVARVDGDANSNYASVGPIDLPDAGTYYIVFRERKTHAATFSVELSSPNRTQPFTSAGCPGAWTDGAAAGQNVDLDFSTIAGTYMRTAVADLPSGGLAVTWPLPAELTLTGGTFTAQMEQNGMVTAEQGSFVAENNFMLGPILVLMGGSPPTDDRYFFRVVGLAREASTISRMCLAQLSGPTGRAFTLAR